LRGRNKQGVYDMHADEGDEDVYKSHASLLEDEENPEGYLGSVDEEGLQKMYPVLKETYAYYAVMLFYTNNNFPLLLHFFSFSTLHLPSVVSNYTGSICIPLLYTYMCIYLCIQIYIYVYIYMYTNIYLCNYMCIYIYIYVCLCIHVCVRVCIAAQHGTGGAGLAVSIQAG